MHVSGCGFHMWVGVALLFIGEVLYVEIIEFMLLLCVYMYVCGG